MRKFSMRFAILCILALLIGVTALAVSGSVSKLKNQDANVVEVKLNPGNAGEGPTFSITRKNAENGKLYTVLIRSGAENENPSGGENGNIVYMDTVEAVNGEVSVTKAYPKEMVAGTYRVFVSDYGKKAIAQAATFEVGDIVDTEIPNDAKLGDVNGDRNINMDDALAIMRHIAKAPGWDLSEKLSVADVSGNQTIDMDDALAIMRHIAKVPGWDLS